MAIDRCMDKEDVVYIDNGVLLSHKKEWNLAICNNMDGPREYYAKCLSQKDKYHMISPVYQIFKNETKRNRLTNTENKLVVGVGIGWNG